MSNRATRSKYMIIGYIVSKFVVPVAKKQARKAAREKARGASRAVTGNPARTSIALGAAAGATAWLLSRRSGTNETPFSE